MASSSCPKQCSLSMDHNASAYPTALATYEDVVTNQKLFMDTLEKLHCVMGTKFMIPIIGGRDLDLHKLFLEVTSRGGIEKLIIERRLKEVTTAFSFPPTATNASFVLRKYYYSLLYHYEQVYFLKAHSRIPHASLQSPSARSLPAHGNVRPSLKIQAIALPHKMIDSAETPGASSSGLAVIGVIDGKFESGYLVTVTIGSEKLRGVLYQIPQNTVPQTPQSLNVFPNNWTDNANSQAPPGKKRHWRRKKSQIKRRDPAHPKPNRSGYNFFFSEQHARLKLLHSGKDREISKMIAELWNKLNEQGRKVYQEKAVADKVRYQAEMEDYREKLKTGQVISNAIPLQQRLPQQDTDMVEADVTMEEEEEEGKSSGGCSGESESEDDHNSDSEPGLEERSASPSTGSKEKTENLKNR